MLFDQEFIESVENEPVEGIARACRIAMDRQQELDDGHGWSEDEHEILWEAATFIDMVADIHSLTLGISPPEPTTEVPTNCQLLIEYIKQVDMEVNAHLTRLKIESYKNRYNAALKSGFAYEFSTGDLDRVQQLVNELREHIGSCDALDADHKRRLLKRLETLQNEIHKRVSDLDRFWGLVGDAGVVLGKLGRDAKPIVERVKEVAEIVWRTQARAEELPSGSSNPMLENEPDA